MPDELVTAGSFDQMRTHIAEQLTRISAENEVRSRLLQEEIDRRFTTEERLRADLKALLDERADNARAARDALQQEIDRRFTDGRRETDERFDSTIHMRVALQEEMDRRFADLSSQLDRRFLDSERAVQAALAAAEKAVVKAEAASEKRFDAVNEFRQQQKDIIADFLTRSEYSSSHQSLADKLDAADKRITERLAALELRLTSRLDLGAGRDSGVQDYRTNAQQEDMVRAAVRQAGAVSVARMNIAVAISGIAALVAIIVLIINLTKK